MTETEFEKGRKVERLEKEQFDKFVMGTICLIVSPLVLFFSNWNLTEKIWGGIILLLIGLVCVYLGNDARKQLQKLNSTGGKNE